MVDKQQLAAMGEHMREMEECNQQRHGAHGIRASPAARQGRSSTWACSALSA